MTHRLALLLATLWAGALWMTGLTAYILFDMLPDQILAGNIAGKLFVIVSYIGLASGFYLLIQRLMANGTRALKQLFFWVVLLMLVLVLAGHFGIQPILQHLKTQALPQDVMKSVYASAFKTWHGVAGIVYVVECLLAAVMVLKVR